MKRKIIDLIEDTDYRDPCKILEDLERIADAIYDRSQHIHATRRQFRKWYLGERMKTL